MAFDSLRKALDTSDQHTRPTTESLWARLLLTGIALLFMSLILV